MAEKMRVHILAKALNVTSKAILEKCRAEGLTVKNHMSTLTAGQEATLREWFSEGTHETTVEVAERVNLEKVRAPRRKRRVKKTVAAGKPETPAAEPAVAVATDTSGPPEGAPDTVIEEPVVSGATAVAEAPTTVEAGVPGEAEAAAPPVEAEAPSVTVETAAPAMEGAQAAAADEAPARAAAETAAPAAPPTKEEELGAVQPVAPAGPQNVPKPPRLRGPRVVRYEAPERDSFPPSRTREGRDTGLAQLVPGEVRPGPPSGRARTRRRGEVLPGKPGVKDRVHGRRRGVRTHDEVAELAPEWRDRDLIERRERLEGATGRWIHARRIEMRKGGVAAPAAPTRKTHAEVQEPIKLKDFCGAIGVPFLQVLSVLKRDYDRTCNINSVIEKETAELVAAEFEVELKVAEAKTSLDVLEEESAARPREHLRPRCPVVTVLGHVDHGKTSLLDTIRRTHVTAREDGGITQHIGAYSVETPAGQLTFVDTPGHEAFTAMRARGANLTDIVVLVVAADDGVMPQTVEAIHHAQAAGVPVVVALNKIDLGRDKEVEIYGQLAANGLTPGGEWGGETDVIATSAVTGEGIDDLLEHLVALGEVMELRADPTVAARATVIEAETKEGVGPVVRVLVREGTLKRGDIVVCGNAAGKIRALHNDRGQLVDSAGPSMPVEIWGLEDVPLAGDTLHQVGSMQRAKVIATEVAQRRLEEARNESRKVWSLEELFKRRDAEEIPELNVIIKADVDGSADVLRHSLGQIPSDKVKLHILHAGVGAVNDSDVVLAEASGAIIIAFRVVAQPGAKKMAEARGVDLRYSRVVYEVVDDMIRAMEGRLPPVERMEMRASAEVREVFRISKVGLVAGCMVTEGTVVRNHEARVVRDEAVIREGCKVESLRHFKEDMKEVRAGMECGIRLDGFDDVKPGDVIETYETVEVARTL